MRRSPIVLPRARVKNGPESRELPGLRGIDRQHRAVGDPGDVAQCRPATSHAAVSEREIAVMKCAIDWRLWIGAGRYGLTQNTFIVFTATAFSLLGLRQLFFLIEGLLDRLIYLSYGLAAILGFIGVKLILHAMHENNVPFINDGDPVPVVEISTGLSLTVILGLLVVTVVASLLSPAGKARTAITNARRHATSFLDSEYTADSAERERIFGLLLDERDQIVALGAKYTQKVRDEKELMALLERARSSHDAAVERGEAVPAGEPKILPPKV